MSNQINLPGFVADLSIFKLFSYINNDVLLYESKKGDQINLQMRISWGWTAGRSCVVLDGLSGELIGGTYNSVGDCCNKDGVCWYCEGSNNVCGPGRFQQKNRSTMLPRYQ